MDAERIVQQGRRIEPHCAVATSPEARAFKVEFRKKSRREQELCLAVYARADLPNLVRLVLAAGLSPDTHWQGAPVLSHAATNGAAGSLKALLEAGADVTLDDDGATALHSAVVGGSVAVISLLLDAGSNIEAKISDGGCSPLGLAALLGKLGAIGKLLARGANANSADNSGATPLMHAIQSRHPLAVRALLPVSDLSQLNMRGRSALHHCVVHGTDEIFELLLMQMLSNIDVRAVPNSSGEELSFGQSALHLACHHGRHAMTAALLRRGAQRTAVDSTGSTPLLSAANCSCHSCVVLLVGRPGAFRMTPAELDTPTIAKHGGFNALHCAALRGHIRTCGVLLQAGASLDATTAYGETALVLAQKKHPTNTPLHALLAGNWAGPLPGTACEHCDTVPDSALLHCSGCQAVRYCCSRCATADWPRHAAFCKERREARDVRDRPAESI